MRKKKLKKVITTALLAGFITMNIAPVFAIDEVKKSSAPPKEFKSYVKKNKKTSDDYKYNYINTKTKGRKFIWHSNFTET